MHILTSEKKSSLKWNQDLTKRNLADCVLLMYLSVWMISSLFSGHRCSHAARGVKHHAPHCRKLSSSSSALNDDVSRVTRLSSPHNEVSRAISLSVIVIATQTQILIFLWSHQNRREEFIYNFVFDVTGERYYLNDEIDDRFNLRHLAERLVPVLRDQGKSVIVWDGWNHWR